MGYTYIVYRGFNHSVCVLRAEFCAFLHLVPSRVTHTHNKSSNPDSWSWFLQNLPSSVLTEVLWIWRMPGQLMTLSLKKQTIISNSYLQGCKNGVYIH